MSCNGGRVLNLDIDVGTDFYIDTSYEDNITKLPMDLTGYSALMELRPSWNDNTLLLTLSSGNGKILLGGVDGTILVHFSPADTAQPAGVYWDRAVYDLILTDNNNISFKLISGMINLVGVVSR